MKEHVLAIIGFGGMAQWHYELIENLDGLSVAGIWDIRAERREYARSKEIPVYASQEALLADERVDLVLIATPNDVHKSIAIAAMEAGKNVVSEKPVTLCLADLQEMIDASQKYGRFLTVHQNRRWDEDFLTVKRKALWGRYSGWNPECTAPGEYRETGGRSRNMAAAWYWTGEYIFWTRRSCFFRVWR